MNMDKYNNIRWGDAVLAPGLSEPGFVTHLCSDIDGEEGYVNVLLGTGSLHLPAADCVRVE
jgi:hypothetical protein